jgi:hypothetical protein
VKTFCSAQDIEDLAAQGKTELVIDENTVLTDLARHTAEQLGVSVVYRTRTVPVSPPPPSREAVHGVVVALGSKPRGCQHGSLANQSPAPGSASTASNTVVDQLVGLVKRLGTREASS